jgi:hypothetical protein
VKTLANMASLADVGLLIVGMVLSIYTVFQALIYLENIEKLKVLD